jgi:uncharacterized protein
MLASTRKLSLSLLTKPFVICRLAAEAPIPAWATRGDFYSVTRTNDELSLLVEMDVVPADLRAETSWRAMKAHGPFAFSEVGVLASLVTPLAENEVSVFTISTFDTDYLFIRSGQLQAALAALRKAGHTVHEPERIS